MNRLLKGVLVAATSVALIAAAGCTSSKGATDNSESSSPAASTQPAGNTSGPGEPSASPTSAPAATTKTGQLTIAAILGPLEDPFFPPMHQGLVDAAAGLNVELRYLSAPEDANFTTAYAKLIEQAVAMKPDAILVGDYVPDSFDPILKQGIAQGIPVVVVQSGQSSWEALGALTFVGQDVNTVGDPAAAAFTKAGAKNVLCVNKGAGNPYLEAICTSLSTAMKSAGGSATMYSVPLSDSSDPTTLSRNIAAQLQSNPGYDAIFTQGAGDAVAAADAIDRLGKSGQIKLGTLALNSQVLSSIKDGSVTFALDEQPYLDGYYSMVVAAQYLRYRLVPTNPLYLGFVTIDAGNVDGVLDVTKQSPGIRGSS